MIFFGVCVSGLLFVVNVYGVSNLFFYVSRVLVYAFVLYGIVFVYVLFVYAFLF